jgi:spermidine/putrescine transport system substrate-binding protein
MAKILIPRVTAERLAYTLNRRHFLALSGATAAAAFLAACSGGGGGGKSINLFTWAEYDDEKLLNSWGDITIDLYGSNEEAIQKLAAAKGSSGYDVVVPTGVFIPQMVREDLLEPLDLDKIPNFANIDVPYTNQDWDPGNKYSVCKDWGSTGWIYDNTVITDPLVTWADFLAAIEGPASGKASVLDTPGNLCGLYFWANDIDWTTEKTEDLDACEEYLVNTLASHIKAFDSYPGIALTQDNYVLSQAWNGDARQGLLSVEEAGGDLDKYTWALGAPVTELWMDNWCIVKGAENLDDAHDFINFILDKENSITDLEFHGYNTGMAQIESLLPDDLKFKDMIFFTEEQVATFTPGAVNSAQDRLVDIYNKTKAEAGA